jgi:P27 family predicted phage terminase small subunit
MRGRKPKPSALKDLHGSKEPRNALEPKPVGDLEGTTAPDHFSPDQVETWNFALEHAPPGMLKQIDRSALEAWVVARSLHRRAVIAQSKTGLIIKSPEKGIPIQSPYLPIINRQALIMLKAASELGFTPVSRPRVMLSGAAGGAGLGGSAHDNAAAGSLQAYLDGDPASTARH